MRPHSFWSAFLIYGSIWVIFWLIIGVSLGRPTQSQDILLLFALYVSIGLLCGLLSAFGFGPTTRTFAYDSPELFRTRFEESVHSSGYRLLDEDSSRHIYRRGVIRT